MHLNISRHVCLHPDMPDATTLKKDYQYGFTINSPSENCVGSLTGSSTLCTSK
jgi:hypothetical protein